MPVLFTFLLGLLICLVVYVLSTMCAAFLFRLPMEEVGLCSGPTLARFQIGETVFSLKCLPFGANVKLSEDFYASAPLYAKVCVGLFGHGAVFALAVLCLNWEPAGEMFVATFEQVFLGAIHPLTLGRDFADAALDFLTRQDDLAILGAIAAKQAAINVLPIPILSGGMVLIALIENVIPISEGIKYRIYLVGFFIFIAILIGWLVALVGALSN